jgi:multiple antibiotic resistance protein
VAKRGILLAFGIVLVFAVAGNAIFRVFGIGLPAFTITGGLLVLLIGFHMVQGQSSSVQNPKQSREPHDIKGELDKAVSPLAMPLLAGPGTITTAINFSTGSANRLITTVVVFLVLCIITYLCFVYGERLVKHLGSQGMGVITRLMGLILAAIGVQMVIDGVTKLLHS